jgi:hypothetical protein
MLLCRAAALACCPLGRHLRRLRSGVLGAMYVFLNPSRHPSRCTECLAIAAADRIHQAAARQGKQQRDTDSAVTLLPVRAVCRLPASLRAPAAHSAAPQQRRWMQQGASQCTVWHGFESLADASEAAGYCRSTAPWQRRWMQQGVSQCTVNICSRVVQISSTTVGQTNAAKCMAASSSARKLQHHLVD